MRSPFFCHNTRTAIYTAKTFDKRQSKYYTVNMQLTYTITQPHNGLTVKQYLTEVLHLSRTNIIALKTTDYGILLNGRQVTVRHIVSCGDCLVLNLPESPCNIAPNSNTLDIVYQDKYIYIVYKPQGLPIHPDRKYKTDTLGNRIIGNVDFDGTPQLHIVTRLDKDTQGLVLGAKDCITKRLLTEMLESQQIQKTYLAKVLGHLPQQYGTIDLPLSRNDNINTTYPDVNGKTAVTHYKVLWHDTQYSLVMLNPISGRTHQLRAHLKALGCPIVGDSIYGDSTDSTSNLCLLMYKLQLTHPHSKQRLCFASELPQWVIEIQSIVLD